MENLKHKHLIIRAEVSAPPQTEEQTIIWMKELIKKIDMKILAGPFSAKVDKKGNEGITCATIIETSHVVIHTWDAIIPALVQLDVYSCKDFKKQDVLDCLEQFYPTKVDYKYYDRENNFKLLRKNAK